MKNLAGWLFLLCLGLCMHQLAFGEDVVTTADGKLQGKTSGDTSFFLGIPFAAPPVGALRWKAPEPVTAWTGIRKADQFGSSCMQEDSGSDTLGSSGIDEDCLYLNLWRPISVADTHPLPVMVWIHGGSFFFGSGAGPSFDGAGLARRGVIVVTINYRLGSFGWFAHPELSAEKGASGTGNFGLMDQIAALKWVQTNIAAFGGDPTNVTVFGESAGAISVNFLMTMPAARGLFAKAITESGLGRLPARTLAEAQIGGTKFAHDLGKSSIASLRALPAETIFKASQSSFFATTSPGPIIDGTLVTEDVVHAFAAGHEAPIPWIVGSNDFEASLFPSRVDNPDSTLASIPDYARDQMALLFDPHHGGPKVEVANIMSDVVFTEPARYLAGSHVKHNASTYRYFFAYTPETMREDSYGARHGGEVQFVFGTLGAGRTKGTQYTASDRATCDTIGRYWTNFAKTGNPNASDLALWPADEADQLLLFDATGEHAEKEFRKDRLDLFLRRVEARTGAMQ